MRGWEWLDLRYILNVLEFFYEKLDIGFEKRED